MALHVVDAGQYVESASAPNVGPAFTVSAWYRPTTLNAGTVLGIGSSGTSQYVALGMAATGNGFLEVNGGGTADAFATGNFTDAVWHHLGGVSVSNTSRTFYADGVAGTTNTTAITPSGGFRDRVTIGALRSNGSLISTAQGDIAECAIWSVDLSAAEIAALAAGFSPLLIRPAALVFYAPLIGRGDPEQDTRGSLALPYGAGAAAPTVVPHPRVLGTGRPPSFGTPTTSITVTLTSVTLSDTAQPLTVVKRPALTSATVTDTAAVLTRSKRPVLTPVALSDVAQSLRVAKQKTLTPVALTDTAVAPARVKAPVLSPVALTDAAQALAVLKPIHKTLTPVGMLDTAVALAILGAAPPWSYSGDDTPAFTYGGGDTPDWTYGGD